MGGLKPAVSFRLRQLSKSVLLSCAGASLVLPTIAAAAESNPPRRAAVLEEVVVTARKREETLQDIPVAISALSFDYLDRYDISDLESVAAMYPQMNIARSSSGAGAQISMRGIGSSYTSIGVEQSVATIIDGVYYPQGRVINEGLYDLKQVEILKGPQALFFGKNATAGVISVTTADPTHEFETRAKVGYEYKAREWSAEFAASGPITDNIGFRLAFMGKKQNRGYVKNKASPVNMTFTDVATGDTHTFVADPSDKYPGQELFAARGTLVWDATDRLSVNVKASITRDRHDNPAWNYITHKCTGPNNTSILAPGQPCKRDFAHYNLKFPREVAAHIPFVDSDGDLGNEWDSYNITAKIDYDLDWGSFTSVTNWHQNKNQSVFDGNYVGSTQFVGVAENWKFEAFSTEARVLTDFTGPVNAMVGVYIQDTKLDMRQFTGMSPIMDSSAPHSRQFVAWDKDSSTEGETYAAYTQLMWEISPTVELSTGVRYTYETKDSYFNQPFVHPLMQDVIRHDYPFTRKQRFKNWTPEATITWTPMDGLMVYAAYKEGYKSGGFSASAIFGLKSREDDLAFDSEEVKGFEVGVKGRILDNGLGYAATVYDYEYTDLQIDFFNAKTMAFITTNAGSATTKGVELEVDYIPALLPDMTIRGSVNYNKARYEDYLAPCYGGQTIAEGCNTERYGVPHQKLDGFPTSVAPRWTASLGVNYDVPLTAGLRLNLDLDATYSDSYLASAFGDMRSLEPSYTYVNAAIQLIPDSEQWKISLVGKNLTDKFVSMGGQDTVGTGDGTGTTSGIRSDLYGLIGMPRTVQLSAEYRF